MDVGIAPLICRSWLAWRLKSTMSTLSVRVSEDPSRPLGHAIVTLEGLPRSLETFEFALSRHGFAANHLGADGWQGAECWLQPEEAWYSGDALKFVLDPDRVFQLENMPYRLAVRGQGLPETVVVTFVWPLELAIEDGTTSGERRPVGGTRVTTGPKAVPSEQVPAAPFDRLRTAPVPPPMPELAGADLPIPDMPIPALDQVAAASAPALDADSMTRRVTPAPPPAAAEETLPTRVVAPVPHPLTDVQRDPEPTRKTEGRRVPPPEQPADARVFGGNGDSPSSRPLETGSATSAPLPAGRSAHDAPTESSPPVPDVQPGRKGSSALLLGLLIAAILAAIAVGGWWWLGRQSPSQPQISSPAPVAPEPKPAPEPLPAPEPKPAPEPLPAPEPRPLPPQAAPALPPPVAPPVVMPPPQPVAPPVVTPPPQPIAPPVTVPAPRPVKESPRPGSGRSLEEELKSQFDPTLQELEKGLRKPAR